MDSGSFNGIAVFLVLAVITGVITYLAVQQSKIKRQIEEDRRKRERDELTALGGISPTTTGMAPRMAPGDIPDITPQSLPKITPGGTPNVPPGLHLYEPPEADGASGGGSTPPSPGP